jgi:multidrug efflux pump subunit AcrA (membrane-fusion protein)
MIEIAFSPTAAKNIGIDDSTIARVEVVDYYKSITFPAVVTDRPGHSVINVPSPVSGVVTKIYQESGVAVSPGEALFDILLNQQEIIRGQTEFLALLNQKEINDSEIERLSTLGESLVPQKKRELDFDRRRIDVDLNNQRKVLQLQGLTDQQIHESLETQREIIQSVTVYVPFTANGEGIVAKPVETHPTVLNIDQFHITIGQNTNIGDSLCQLSDLNQLTIQGKVFAADIKTITRALDNRSNVSAVFRTNGDRESVNGLKLRSIDNRISEDFGTVHCYVDLPNTFQEYEPQTDDNQRRYVQWHFKPGQRCELNVDYEVIPGCIVLPVDAVAQDMGEMYVFEWVGNEDDKRIWRKRSVHVLHKTKDVAVIANDGCVFPGARVVTKGASFILAALDAANQKNAGGGGVQHGDHVH